jgi:hypothetical protein
VSHSDGIGKVYKLYVPDLEEFCYIGSTFCPLIYRLQMHKSQAHLTDQTKSAACVMFENNNEPIIELVEALPGCTKEILIARERYWIEQYPNCLNKNIPGQTWQERWAKNRDRNLAKHKEWVEANQEHIAAYNEAYKPIKKEKAKERYAEGYGVIRNARKKEQVECPECKKIMNKGSLWTHKNSVHK